MTARQKHVAKEVLKRMKTLTVDEVGDYAAVWFHLYALALAGKINVRNKKRKCGK